MISLVKSASVVTIAAAFRLIAEAQSGSGCEALRPATVKVEGSESGAGVIMRVDSGTVWIATALHVVSGSSRITVSFSSAPTTRVMATLAYPRQADSPSLDLAILKVAVTRGVALQAPTARTDALREGESVSYVGHPGDLGWQCYLGRDVVSRLSYHGDDRLFLFTNPMAQRGLSGGPVFDASNRLVGVMSGEGQKPNSVAIRISSVLRILFDEIGVVPSRAAPESRTLAPAPGPPGRKSTMVGPITVELLGCHRSGTGVRCRITMAATSDVGVTLYIRGGTIGIDNRNHEHTASALELSGKTDTHNLGFLLVGGNVAEGAITFTNFEPEVSMLSLLRLQMTRGRSTESAEFRGIPIE